MTSKCVCFIVVLCCVAALYSTIALGAFSFLAIIVIIALTVCVIRLKKRPPETRK